MRKVKIGIIGANKLSHSAEIATSLLSNSDVFDVVGYAMPENEKEKYPHKMNKLTNLREMTLDEMLNDDSIEAVAIETDEIHLTKYAKLAAEHGKHIHMEKPGGTSYSEFAEMIEAVKKGGKVFHTGYMYRYNPVIMKLMDDIKAGVYGEILSVEAQMNCWHTPENRQWLECFPGGMMFFLGCHLVDIILRIQGEPLEVIPLSCSTNMDGVTSEDFGMAVFKYENGVSFAKTTSAERGGFTRRQIVITGTEGVAEIKPVEINVPGGQQTVIRERFDTGWNEFGTEETSEVHDRYDKMMESFAAMVRGEIVNPTTPDYELLLHKYVLKACGCEI